MTSAAAAGAIPLAPEVRHPSVARARAYLDSRLGQPVPLDELARVSYASKYHLVRTFKKYLGLTPGEYHLRVRLGRARELLEAGLSASRVAYETGFSDQSHLTRSFKRAFGVPPGRYATAAARGALYGEPVLVGGKGAAERSAGAGEAMAEVA